MEQRWIWLTLLVALAVGSAWLLHVLGTKDTETKSSAGIAPDAFMDDFTLMTMNEQGDVRYVLSAPYMEHYPHDDSSALQEPMLVVYEENSPLWYLQSESGKVSSGNKEMLMQGEARVWRNDDAGQPELEVLTRNLRIMPDSQYAESAEATTIRTPSSVTHAVGMRVYMEEQRVQLLAKVRGRYAGR